MDAGEILIYTLALIVAISFFSFQRYLYVKGKEVLSIFPEIDPATLKYRCRQSSASYARRYGGKRVYQVIVTNNELWVRTYATLAFFAAKSNFIQKIPLGNITHKEKNGSKVVIDFNSNGENRRIILRVPNPDAFLAALTP